MLKFDNDMNETTTITKRAKKNKTKDNTQSTSRSVRLRI